MRASLLLSALFSVSMVSVAGAASTPGGPTSSPKAMKSLFPGFKTKSVEGRTTKVSSKLGPKQAEKTSSTPEGWQPRTQEETDLRDTLSKMASQGISWEGRRVEAKLLVLALDRAPQTVRHAYQHQQENLAKANSELEDARAELAKTAGLRGGPRLVAARRVDDATFAYRQAQDRVASVENQVMELAAQ